MGHLETLFGFHYISITVGKISSSYSAMQLCPTRTTDIIKNTTVFGNRRTRGNRSCLGGGVISGRSEEVGKGHGKVNIV
jgi:hypothetical protein